MKEERENFHLIMKPSYCSYVFLGTFIAAIFLLQFWQQASYPPGLWIFLGIVGLLGIIGLILKIIPCTAFVLALILALALPLALFSVARTTHIATPETIDHYANGQEVALHGIIVEEPDRRPLVTKYTIEVESMLYPRNTPWDRNIPVPRGISGKVLVTDHRGYPDFHYGDEVTVRGVLEKPGTIENFAYDDYLSTADIYSIIARGQIEKLSGGHGNVILATLYAVKQRFEAQINRIYPEPHASFLAGLLTGSRRGIPDHVLQAFNATSLTHIIAISGTNITIIMAVIGGFLFWLPRRWRLLPTVIAIGLFTLLVGASASVIRAAIMGTLGLVALQAGRPSDQRLLILWTLFVMLLWNPKYLWYDAGFQLSFLAVIGLNELGPVLKPLLSSVPEMLGIRASLQATISAQLVAMPWIIVIFHRFSLLSIPANILVAPLVPLAMLFGFLGTLVSFLWFFGGQVLSYAAWGCMELIIRIATQFARLPFAFLEISRISIGAVILYYLGLSGILVRKSNTRTTNNQ